MSRQEAQQAIAAMMNHIAKDGKIDWLNVMQIWTSHTEPKLSEVIGKFVKDAQTVDAAASVVLLMATAFEAGRALQVAHLMYQTQVQLGSGLSVGPRAVPAVIALPTEPMEIKLDQDQAYDEEDYNRFLKAGGKVTNGKHRIYLIRNESEQAAASNGP